MNIRPGENMNMALQAVWNHRFRSLLTILGIVIGITTVVTVAALLTGLRQGVVVFFQELGPDNIFLFKTSGDPSMEPPKEQKRRPMKPEYADEIRRWCGSVQDVGMELLIPPVVDGNPILARVPGFETENINVEGDSANIAEVLWGGPAYQAKLTLGGQILAVNGVAYSPDVLKDAIRSARSTNGPIELIVKNGATFTVAHVDYHGGLRYPHLERDSSQPARLDEILAPRP